MSNGTPDSSPLKPWLALVRFPAVFTVVAQVAGAYLFAAGGMIAWGRLALILASGVALYWAGMILNDLWDQEEDARDRPTRPIPSGQISAKRARAAGIGSLIVGIALAAGAGLVQQETASFAWAPAIISGLLAICIVLYDGPLKATGLAPATMGSCRMFCFLLGASAAVAIPEAAAWQLTTWFAPQTWVAAVGMGIYVMGITQISLTETTGGPRSDLVIGVALMLLGSVCLAVAVSFAPPETTWEFNPGQRFPLLIGMIVISVLVRGIRVIAAPQIMEIRQLIRLGLLTLIPFSAALALVGGGPGAGIAVFALVVPSLWMSRRVQIT